MKLTIFLSLFLLFLSSKARCDEPSEQFLQALRERGYYDVALDYLDEMETSPLASSQFQAVLPYEKAQTLISSTNKLRDLKSLEERLGQAEQLLSRAEASADTLEYSSRLQDCQGDLLFRRAQIYLTLAENDRLTAEEKQVHLDQSQDYLNRALATFEKALESYRGLLDDFQVDLRDPDSKNRLKQLRGTYTVVRMKLPQIRERLADALDTDDPVRTDNLTKAAADFEELWLKYPNFPAGLDSCLYAARCRYKLQEYSNAISLLQQLLMLPDSSTLMTLKRRAMNLAADCWSQLTPYPFDDVIANLQPYCARLSRREQREADWQRIQLELARAWHAKAVNLTEQGGDTGRIKNLNREAAKLIKSVARSPGEHRADARKLLEKWDLNLDETTEIETAPILTFTDARQRSLDLISELEALHAETIEFRTQPVIPGMDPQDSEEDLAAAEQRLQQTAAACLAVLARAMALAEPNSSREDINQIRYLQSVCNYLLKRYYESALIGEFLVDRFAGLPFSRQAGGIAVRSYAMLHDTAAPDDKEFERDRLTLLAKKIIDRWPGSAESTTASATLAKLILDGREISDEDIETVQDYVELVSAASVERAALNIKLGNKLWFAYLNKKQQGMEGEPQLAARLASAIDYLSQGTADYDSGNLTIEAAWGALFLVDALVQAGEIDRAVVQLETASVAPIDLVKQKSPIVLNSENADLYIGEAYKTAGKTYLAALGRNSEDIQWIDKAIGIVTAMQTRADQNADPAEKQDVINMYRLVAAEMEQQLVAMDDPEKQRQFVGNLVRFLQTIQTESNDPNTIIWAGRTAMDLADLFIAQSMQSDAEPLLKMAIAALDRASGMGIEDEKLADELKRQQAIAKRRMGKYQESYDALLELLTKNPNAWHVQIDMAETLQAWGVQSRSKEQLARALGGTEKYRDPETKRQKLRVWGWSRLADVLKSNPGFKEHYYRCLFGAIETRLEYGLIEQNPRVIAAALKKLNIARAQDQQLGGETWKAQFEELEDRIRQSQTSTQVSGATDR